MRQEYPAECILAGSEVTESNRLKKNDSAEISPSISEF
jgi:hypothetical protein